MTSRRTHLSWVLLLAFADAGCTGNLTEIHTGNVSGQPDAGEPAADADLLAPDANPAAPDADPAAPDSGALLYCGDGECNGGESCSTCEADCGPCAPSCGDDVCNGGESCASCPDDCGACPPVCGDGECNGAETCSSCEVDCGECAAVCGDGECNGTETCSSCESDCGACPPVCGDGSCDGGETCSSCESDCGPCEAVCGDGVCNGLDGETCPNCGQDCSTLDPVCGNGACDSGESSESCYPDCGPAVWPSDWAAWEQEVLDLINQHRVAGTDCPNGDVKDPMGTLTMGSLVQVAARLHSFDMSYSGYFDHTSCNGRSPWDRAAAVGTSASGECIGMGYSSPAAMVDGWMNSPGHCAILMNSGMTQVGVGYAAEGGRYWTALFR